MTDGPNAPPPSAYLNPIARPPTATEPIATPPIDTPNPSATPPSAPRRPNDTPPSVTMPMARPPIARPPIAILPNAMTPFAARGRIVTGSTPMQMCTSGHDPIEASDLYSHPNITGLRATQSRQVSRGVSRPTQSRQMAF